MSMLAEKRRKGHQFFIVNPRTTAWSKDSNKYGQRMLEKMGWKPGNGLGVNQQGMSSALRIKQKNDLRGLGCNSKEQDWTKVQEEFNSLLGELSGLGSKEVGLYSLEATSKNIRTRVHYPKFTRGKDLSRYSAKDLECILGVNSSTNSEMVRLDTDCQEIEILDSKSDISESEDDEKREEDTAFKNESFRNNRKKKKLEKLFSEDFNGSLNEIKQFSFDKTESPDNLSSPPKKRKKKTEIK